MSLRGVLRGHSTWIIWKKSINKLYFITFGTSGVRPTVDFFFDKRFESIFKSALQHDKPIRCSCFTCRLRRFLRYSLESDYRTRFPLARRVRETLVFVSLADFEHRGPWIKHCRVMWARWMCGRLGQRGGHGDITLTDICEQLV